MRKALILGLVVILVGVLPLDFYGLWYTNESLYSVLVKVALIVPGVVFVVWFWRWIGWYYTMYLVTNQRLLAIKQKGLFDRQVDEWQLEGINNLNYHIGGFQAVLFGFGDITARTYMGDLEMKTIHKPAEVHAKLMTLVRKAGGASGSTRSPN
jgi:uncharacterized membrane protein YdbT with pleckstrin-like domain